MKMDNDEYIAAAIPWGLGTIAMIAMALTGCCASFHVLFIGWLIFTAFTVIITWAGTH